MKLLRTPHQAQFNRVSPSSSSLILAFATAFCMATGTAAQTPVPVPAEIGSAHTVFLAPAGLSIPNNEDYVGIVYASTYEMLAGLGPYQMATKPADADLAVEVSIITKQEFDYLRLTIIDARTRTLLWVVDSPIAGVFNQKSLAAAESRAADDLNDLIHGNFPISPSSKKKQQKH